MTTRATISSGRQPRSGAVGAVPDGCATCRPRSRGRCAHDSAGPLPALEVAPSTVRCRSRAARSRPRPPGPPRPVAASRFLPCSRSTRSALTVVNRSSTRRTDARRVTHLVCRIWPQRAASSTRTSAPCRRPGPRRPTASAAARPRPRPPRAPRPARRRGPGRPAAATSRPGWRSRRRGRSGPRRSGRRRRRRRAGPLAGRTVGVGGSVVDAGQPLVTRSATARPTSAIACGRRLRRRSRRPARRRPCRLRCRRARRRDLAPARRRSAHARARCR